MSDERAGVKERESSWAMANQGGGSYDRHFLFGATAVQYATWVGGTAIGALGGGAIGDPRDPGLDAIFPAFFVALLLPELRSVRSRAPSRSAAASCRRASSASSS